jgi:hypothetical protein
MNRIAELESLPFPFPTNWKDNRANCFNAVLVFWGRESSLRFCGPEQFVTELRSHTHQVNASDARSRGDVAVVWSRSADSLPLGHIDITRLRAEAVGYPFGLVIEHAFIYLSENSVFQKRDPTAIGPYEIINPVEALRPYTNRRGVEVTFHRLV